MTETNWLAAFKEQPGCGLVWLVLTAWLIFSVGYMAYWFASGGSPENWKIWQECYRERTVRYGPGELPDFLEMQIALDCDKDLRARQGIK